MSFAAMSFQASPFDNPTRPLFSGPILWIELLWAVVLIVGLWKMFEKAGQPGWAVLIPLYNAYILLKVARRPGWWLLLYLIPVVNIVIVIIVAIDVARSFGRSAAFGFFLNFLLFGIGYAVLGFGSAQYQRVVAFAATR